MVENIEPSTPLVEVSPTQTVTPTIIPKATLQPTNTSTIPSGIVLVSIIDAGMQYCRADMVDTVNNLQQQKTDIFNKTVDCRMDVSNAVKPGEISPCYTQEEHDTIQKAIKILQDNCIDKRGVDAYGTHVLERLK